MTENSEKWSEMQGKWDLVRVSGEFELPRSYCATVCIFSKISVW